MDENDKKQYNRYVEKVTPTHSVVMQMVKAFAVGGCVCVLGQIIYNIAIFYWHLDKTSASTWCSLILIFISVLLTAAGLYPKITKFAGAGLLVPITGFANSVAAAAIEKRRPGIRCRSQNIYDSGTCYSVRHTVKFCAWIYILARNLPRMVVTCTNRYTEKSLKPHGLSDFNRAGFGTLTLKTECVIIT